jgi:hypothetical protein
VSSSYLDLSRADHETQSKEAWLDDLRLIGLVLRAKEGREPRCLPLVNAEARRAIRNTREIRGDDFVENLTLPQGSRPSANANRVNPRRNWPLGRSW